MKIKRLFCCILLLSAMVLQLNSTAMAYDFENVSEWAQPDAATAYENHIIWEHFLVHEPREAVTREEFAAISTNAFQAMVDSNISSVALEVYGYDLDEVHPFTDCDLLFLNNAYIVGLVHGTGNNTFTPTGTITRQDLCVMLYNTLQVAADTKDSQIKMPQVTNEITVLERFADNEQVADYAKPAVAVMVGNGIMTGIESNGNYLLAPNESTTREQASALVQRFLYAFSDNNENRWDLQKAGSYNYPETPLEKEQWIYGYYPHYYTSAAEAEPHMTNITVKVWKLGKNDSKYTSTIILTVNEKLAPLFEKVFEEIYNGPEKFPIWDAGAYNWRDGKYEHPQGTAIDINSNANMECYVYDDGRTVVSAGSFWKPGENPYSITPDGDVVKAFQKYGFFWAGHGWHWGDGCTKYDYMHFSYFGN